MEEEEEEEEKSGQKKRKEREEKKKRKKCLEEEEEKSGQKKRKKKEEKKREREMSLSSSTTLANALLKRALMTTAGLTRGRSTIIPSSASWASSSSSHKGGGGGGVGRRFDAHVFFGSPLAEKRTVSSTRGTKSSAALSAALSAHQPSEEEDEHYMRLALKEAEKAFEAGEVPVGAVLVHKKDPNDQHVIARSHNTSESRNNPLAHAELECIDLGRKALGEWRRLKDSTLYVTLEPCNHFGRTAACSRALVYAGVKRVLIGAYDTDPRVAGGGMQTLLERGVEVVCGCKEKEATEMNRAFFDRIEKERIEKEQDRRKK